MGCSHSGLPPGCDRERPEEFQEQYVGTHGSQLQCSSHQITLAPRPSPASELVTPGTRRILTGKHVSALGACLPPITLAAACESSRKRTLRHSWLARHSSQRINDEYRGAAAFLEDAVVAPQHVTLSVQTDSTKDAKTMDHVHTKPQ